MLTTHTPCVPGHATKCSHTTLTFSHRNWRWRGAGNQGETRGGADSDGKRNVGLNLRTESKRDIRTQVSYTYIKLKLWSSNTGIYWWSWGDWRMLAFRIESLKGQKDSDWLNLKYLCSSATNCYIRTFLHWKTWFTVCTLAKDRKRHKKWSCG